MRQTILIILLTAAVATSAAGQLLPVESYLDTSDWPIPTVRMNAQTSIYQNSLYPDFYKQNSLRNDMRWLAEHDSALTEFWNLKGDSVLLLLTELSGLDWAEDAFDVYLVRYYPSTGGSDPLAIPVGGLRKGVLATAAPEGSLQQLNLIYQLSHRMLAQTERSEDPFQRAVAGHPLMQPTPYRRDNIAMLLAMVTAQRIIGLDSTLTAYNSDFWKKQHPGRQIFEQYLLSEWILSADHPLATWVVEEPYSSSLVRASRPPRRVATGTTRVKRAYIEGLPLKGELGFSVTINEQNRLVVDKIDIERLGYACGLRVGDVIRSVDGRRLRNQKQLIEYILEGLDQGGATVTLLREGQSETILIQPLALVGDEDEYWEDYDSLYFESLPTDSMPDSTFGPNE